jgi:hypothetical protein
MVLTREARPTALLALVAIFGLGGAAAEEPSDARVATALTTARGSADGLGAEIRALLMQEMQQGGAQAAVVACARSAQARTAEYRQRTGVDIRRVSLRHRNAANAPDAFERKALESFDHLPVEARPKAEHWEVVTADGRQWLRYLRPVVTNAMCLNCHGSADGLSAGVKAALAKEYPGDQATGFAAGDVRGAISVRLPLPPAAAPNR